MKITVKELYPPYEKHGLNLSGLSPSLTCMIHDTQPERRFPAVIVVPGGSYSHCSEREGDPVAARFYSHGYNAFILRYSCVSKPFPTALAELCEAVRYVRSEERLCCTDRLTVCGFSAGGHLAASLGAYAGEFEEVYGNVRPDSLILCYPVITSGKYTHAESARNIAPTPALMDKISLENHIPRDFPPSFIWHCADDRIVPPENSLMLAQRLSERNIPFELHIFPTGGHGIALCDISTMKNNDPRYLNPKAARWFELALDFMGRETAPSYI